MREILEIILSVLAVYGGYTLICHLRDALCCPRRVRRQLRAAVMLTEDTPLAGVAAYARALAKEQKISPERLIILTKDGIMEDEGDASAFGDVYRYINL
ncbi:MAG: hypothetical protein E7632_08735 [Ruminococcaceae bacterium]|nr:hypothetical protein [Oscillospiraceae bacterium]